MIAKVVKNLIFRIKSRNILGGIGPGPFSNPNSRGKHKISSKKVKVGGAKNRSKLETQMIACKTTISHTKSQKFSRNATAKEQLSQKIA